FQVQRCKRGSSAASSNPTLETPQQRCFFKSNTGNAAAALLFQIHHWKRGSSAASLNPRYDRMWGISTPVPRKFQGIEHDGLQRFLPPSYFSSHTPEGPSSRCSPPGLEVARQTPSQHVYFA